MASPFLEPAADRSGPQIQQCHRLHRRQRPGETDQAIERIMHELDEKDFRIHIAGPPYVVEMIRRSLAHDFWYFSLTAVVLFGLTMAAMFRSLRVFLECSPPARALSC